MAAPHVQSSDTNVTINSYVVLFMELLLLTPPLQKLENLLFIDVKELLALTELKLVKLEKKEG